MMPDPTIAELTRVQAERDRLIVQNRSAIANHNATLDELHEMQKELDEARARVERLTILMANRLLDDVRQLRDFEVGCEIDEADRTQTRIMERRLAMIEPVLEAAKVLAREWLDTSGSSTNVDSINEACRAVSAAIALATEQPK